MDDEQDRRSEDGTGEFRTRLTRRQMLAGAGVVTGASATLLSGLSREGVAAGPLPIPSWSKELGKPAGAHPYGSPSPFEKGVIRRLNAPATTPSGYVPPMRESNWSATPLQDLRGIITPNGLFYERHHGGFPTIDPKQHKLVIHGLVKRNLELSMEDFQRFPTVSAFHFLECSGNSDLIWGKATYGGEAESPLLTAQEIHGQLSCAQWTGVRLSDLLREAGADLDRGKWLIVEGADAAAMARSLPMARALDDCILAFSQNGEMLRPEQGYPVRLLVPGCEGNLNVKWVRRLEVTDTPLFSVVETSYYTDLQKTGKARIASLVMEAKSIITFPSGGQSLPEKGFYQIRGIAWSGRGRISHVDISTDGGRNWVEANLSQPVMPKCLTEFTLPWKWDGRDAVLMSRATDETGYTQPFIQQIIKARGKFSEYHNNGIQAWRLESDGKVYNVGT